MLVLVLALLWATLGLAAGCSRARVMAVPLHCSWLFLGKIVVVLVVSGCVACPVLAWFGAAVAMLLDRALAAGGLGQELGLGFSCA